MLLSTRNLHLATVKKLCQRYVGPFQVIHCFGQTAYKLDLKCRFVGVHDVFHVSQLRYHVLGGSSAAPPDPVEVNGEAQYEVECLLRHRAQRGGARYLVRWTGYRPEHDKWIHEIIWAMPRPYWVSTSVHMGYSECFASGIYCTRPLYVHKVLGPIEPATFNLVEALG